MDPRTRLIVNQLVGQFMHDVGCCTDAEGTRLTREPSRDQRSGPMDPNPDYDASDEIEFFFRYVAWGLRGRPRRQRLPTARVSTGLAIHRPVEAITP